CEGTAEGGLGRAGVALRRRVENGLSIWEVELPEAPGEVAFSEPGGPAEPPPLVADLLRGLLRERELVATADGEPKDPGVEVARRRKQRKKGGGKRSALRHLQRMI